MVSSHATISIRRVTSTTGQRLHGSKPRHFRFIELTIQDAQKAGSSIIQVLMTEVQFAHLITNVNSGDSPCTIKCRGGMSVEETPALRTKSANAT